MKRNCGVAFPLFTSLAVSGILFANIDRAMAQITPDNTLGKEKSLVNRINSNRDRIDGGARRGGNLFHSFSEFNVNSGKSVYFANPTRINNIFSRVTGENISNIFGTLGVNGGANLFLINPNGIVFGENAVLDVQGSFTATTADGIAFGERGSFSADTPEIPDLLTVNPSAYLFNQVPKGAIVTNSKASANFNPSPSFDDNLFGLRVPDGQSLSLLGGDVQANGGGLIAISGRIEIGAIAGEGIVGLNNNGSFNLPDDVIRGDVSLTNGAGFLVAGDGGGDLLIAANNISLDSVSTIKAGIFGNLGSSDAQAGDINLNATGTISINESFISNNVFFGATGKAGNLTIDTNTLIISDGGQIGASTFGQGDGGNVTVRASNIELKGTSSDGQFSSGLFTTVGSQAQGNGGNLTISTDNLSLRGRSQLSASTYGNGNSGNVDITAIDSVDLSQGFILAQVGSEASGNAGNLTITTNRLTATEGAQISTSTSGKGNAGDLNIAATEIDLSGEGNNGTLPSGLFAQVNLDVFTGKQGSGKGGNLTVNTNNLRISDGGKIQASTFGNGNAGNLLVNAKNIEILETARDNFQATGIFAEVADPSDRAVGLPGNVERIARGNAGNLTIKTERLSLRNGGGISVSTQSAGNAGNLSIQASDSIEVVGTENANITIGNRSVSFIGANVGSKATGIGGNINIDTGNLTITDEAIISSASEGQKQAGNVNFNVVKNLEVNNGKISTISTQSAGGAINITAGNITLRGNSDIRSNIFSGAGGGGNINVTAGVIIAFDDSDIFAFAQQGRGGNIILDTPAYFGDRFTLNSLQENPNSLQNNDRADLNATGAVSGTIQIPDVSFIQNSLANIYQNFIRTEDIIANSCVSPSQRKEGKFIITGAGGLPQSPLDDEQTSTFPTGEVRNLSDRSWQKGDPIEEPTGVYELENGELVMSRECSKK